MVGKISGGVIRFSDRRESVDCSECRSSVACWSFMLLFSIVRVGIEKVESESNLMLRSSFEAWRGRIPSLDKSASGGETGGGATSIFEEEGTFLSGCESAARV